MSVKKVVITKGMYLDKDLRLLVSFDENDKPVDLINLDVTKVGTVCEATVEKVLTDIEACILKLSTGDKGFIENKRLKPDGFIVKHSDKKLVCQGDKFYVQISQDRKGVKPYSCCFINEITDCIMNYTFIQYYIENYVCDDCEIITDLSKVMNSDLDARYYNASDISLWSLYGLTGILDRTLSKIVHLKSGANIVIEPTEALTVIDVNSGKNYGKSSALDTNREALTEIEKQVRLRSISGIIIIDLLKVSKQEENELVKFAKNIFLDDVSRVQIYGFSNLGLLEVTRSRIYAPFTIY